MVGQPRPVSADAIVDAITRLEVAILNHDEASAVAVMRGFVTEYTPFDAAQAALPRPTSADASAIDATAQVIPFQRADRV
jgi:hypothetical protein